MAYSSGAEDNWDGFGASVIDKVASLVALCLFDSHSDRLENLEIERIRCLVEYFVQFGTFAKPVG